MELQSCVATAVNAGPLHIVDVFLKKPVPDCPFRPRMKEVLRRLLGACHRSTALHSFDVYHLYTSIYGRWICTLPIFSLHTLAGLLCSTRSIIGQVRGICSPTWQEGLLFHNCLLHSITLNFAFIIIECWHSLLRLIPYLQLPAVQSGSREGGGGGGGG